MKRNHAFCANIFEAPQVFVFLWIRKCTRTLLQIFLTRSNRVQWYSWVIFISFLLKHCSFLSGTDSYFLNWDSFVFFFCLHSVYILIFFLRDIQRFEFQSIEKYRYVPILSLYVFVILNIWKFITRSFHIGLQRICSTFKINVFAFQLNS